MYMIKPATTQNWYPDRFGEEDAFETAKQKSVEQNNTWDVVLFCLNWKTKKWSGRRVATVTYGEVTKLPDEPIGWGHPYSPPLEQPQ